MAEKKGEFEIPLAAALDNGDEINIDGKQIKIQNKAKAETEIKEALKGKYTVTVATDKITLVQVNGFDKREMKASVKGVEVAVNVNEEGVAFRAQELSEGKVSVQVGANANQAMSIEIGDMRAQALNITNAKGKGLSVEDAESANEAITAFDAALNTVSSQRANLGAVQNRLEYTISNLDNTAENLTSAESTLRDVDMAKEMMEYSKNNILNQAAQAMISQANQQPQNVLQLLR